jgi:hypothetical protein
MNQLGGKLQQPKFENNYNEAASRIPQKQGLISNTAPEVLKSKLHNTLPIFHNIVEALQKIQSLAATVNSLKSPTINDFYSTCIEIQHQLSLLKSLISPSSVEFALLLSAFIYVDVFFLRKTTENMTKSKAHRELLQAVKEPRSSIELKENDDVLKLAGALATADINFDCQQMEVLSEMFKRVLLRAEEGMGH